MWNDDLFSEAQPLWEAARAPWFTPRCHSVFNAAKSGVGLFVLFPLQHARNTILSDELQLKMQLLVRERLMADAFKR